MSDIVLGACNTKMSNSLTTEGAKQMYDHITTIWDDKDFLKHVNNYPPNKSLLQ